MARGEVNIRPGRITPVSVQNYQQGQQCREARGATISNAVVAFAAFGFGNVVSDSPLWAIVSVHSNPVCMTLSGIDPTATFGIPLAAGASLTVYGKTDINAIRLIRSGGADAQVTITLGW